MSSRAADTKRSSASGCKPAPSPQLEIKKSPKAINCLPIDDSKFDRQRLRRISEQTQIEMSVTEAASIDEALHALRARYFDVILLDQKLPDGDGTAVAELLKKHLGTQAPPIIMISGSEETAMPERAFASGCVDYISKDNLTIPGLEKAITSTLAKTKAASPNVGAPRAEHNADLQSFAEDTVMELRIPLSRMLRLISRAAEQHPSAAAELGGLKAICHEMWNYLDSVLEQVPPR